MLHMYNLCISSSQHVAQPGPRRADTAEGGDGDTQEGQCPTCPRAQPPKTELRGAQTAAQSRPGGVGRPPAAATAGTHTYTRMVSAVAVRYYTTRDLRFIEVIQDLGPLYKIKHDYSQKLHILMVQRDFCLIIDFVTLHNIICCLLCTKDLVHQGAGAHIGLLCSTVAHSTCGNTAVLKSTGQSSKWKCIQSISEKGKCRREGPRLGQRAC